MYRIYHHDDMDGIASAAILYVNLTKTQDVPEEDIKLYSVNYTNLNIEDITKDDTVYMVDFSAKREVMEQILDMAGIFIWIDHHKTAIEACEGLDILGIRRNGTAGCMLTWEWCHPEQEAPKNLRYIGKYDVWDHDSLTMIHHYGIESLGLEPDSLYWRSILSDPDFDEEKFSLIIRSGAAIERYTEIQDAYDMRRAYEKVLEINGKTYRALVCNCGKGSARFKSRFDPAIHDVMIPWVYSVKGYSYSVYSEKPEIDCSEIAKHFGGGGHKGAAGFYTEEQVL